MKRITLALFALSFALTAHGQQFIPHGAQADLAAVPTLHAALGQISTAPGSPVALTWTPSVSCAISGVTCFGTVYRSLAACATVAACTWTALTTAAAPAPTAGPYTDSSVPTTATVASYYVTNTATGNGWTNQESTASNIAVATFQQAPPAPPTGLTATN